MMKVTAAVALACATGASAFVTPSTGAVTTAARRTMSLNSEIKPLEEMYGSTAPIPYFDPAGFAANTDNQELQKYREAEIKHGRVAMLAALGMVVQEQFQPFFPSSGVGVDVADGLPGPAAFHLQEAIADYPLLPLLLIAGVGAVEGFTINKGWSKQDYKEEGLGAGFVANLKEDYFPGDLGFDPLGLYPDSPQAKADIRNKELNNGRLAMIAIWGMWAQELVDHLTLAEHYARYGFGPAN